MKKFLKEMFKFTTLLFGVSIFLFVSVDWRIAIGVLLFGWMLNIEHDEREEKTLF